MPALKPAAPQRYESTSEDDEFELYRNVPVFDEHTGDDGVYYDKRLLECIASNNNARIDDTGDWTPVIVGHTPDPDAPVHASPEIIGYAGPFKVSVIGNKEPRHAIVADFRIFRDKVDTFRQHPRRSVEIWPEESPEQRFFDPIAVLGAETPRRALGLVYSKRDPRGRHPIRYEMAAGATPTVAGGTNTHIPTGIKRKDKHSMDASTIEGFKGQDLAQLIELLRPVIREEAALVQQGIQENNISPEEVAEQEAAMGPAEGGDPAMAGAPVDAPIADPTADPGLAPDPAMVNEPPAEEPELDEDEATPFRKHAYAKLAKYMLDEGDEHDKIEKASKYAQGLDDDDKAEFFKALDKPEKDEDKAFYSKVKYACGGKEDDTPKEAMQYRKERDSFAEKYRKANAEVQKLKKQVSDFESRANKAERAEKYARRRNELQALTSEGYVVDVEDEMISTESFTDEQFTRHATRIREKYQKVPGESLAHLAAAPDRTPEAEKTGKYASQARDVVLKYRKQGRELNYASVLKNLANNNGVLNEAQLV